MHLNNKILVTGVDSGLGKFLFSNINNCIGLTRRNHNLLKKKNKYLKIIHCAFNQKKKLDKRDDYYQYLEDNLILTQKLLKLDYEYFYYISSIEVYKYAENDLSVYFKNFAESLVKKSKKNYKILRCSMILGPTMRENHITKIFSNNQKISLSQNSSFNYILMDDILEYIFNHSHNKKNEIIDFVSNKNISLSTVIRKFRKKVKFGNYKYITPGKYQNPIYNKFIHFDKSSYTNLKNFYKKI